MVGGFEAVEHVLDTHGRLTDLLDAGPRRIQRTSTAISVLELMPPRYDGLLSRLSEQESRGTN
jgi:hypothetical protein